MAYSLQQVVSDGSLNRITVSIDYIDKSNISLFVDDILLPDGTYTWVWDGEDAVITPNVANASVVVIKRNTKFDLPYHDFSAGAVFKDSSIDENFRQMLFIAQEAAEGATATDFYQDLNFHGFRLRKIGNAVEPDDAVPFSQYQADANGAFQQRLLAQAAAAAALVSQNAAAASQGATATSAGAAATSEASALVSRNEALTYRNEAETFRNDAGASATAAATSKSNASISAAEAAASAASINPANLVHISGTETITGAKTFSIAPVVPVGVAGNEAVNKTQLDTKVGLTGNENIAGVKTFASSPVLPGNATSNLQAVPKQQLDAKTVITYHTLTGTIFNYDIPAGCKEVVIGVADLSTNGTSVPEVRIGPAAGVVSTGYKGSSGVISGGSNATTLFTNGAALSPFWLAAHIMHGEIRLVPAGVNVWSIITDMSTSDGARNMQSTFSITLSGVLAKLAITMVNGTDSFDGGTIAVTTKF